MLNIRAGGTIPWLGLGFVAVLDLTLLIALVFLVTPEWVRQAADAYAEQLFVALEQF